MATEQKEARRILVVTAVAVEKEAVERGLQGDPRFEVITGGVGPIAAAATTARALVAKPYDLVISAGIGGGFSGGAEVETLVVATEIIGADLGVETPEGFCSLDEMGFGSVRVPVEPETSRCLLAALQAAQLAACAGPILTVSTATGTAETTAELTARVPGAVAEAMEGYGVALAAQAAGVPVVELRAISNLVGPRDRAAWRIKEALGLLETASAILLEV